MSVSLGDHTFGCTWHEPPPVYPALRRTSRVEVFGLDGIGEIGGGKTSREIPIRCTYEGFETGLALYTALADDDSEKGSDQDTLDVGGVTFANVAFRGVAVDGRNIFFDGASETWVALDVVLLFEQMEG